MMRLDSLACSTSPCKMCECHRKYFNIRQKGLDGALSNLVWWKMSLIMAGGLEQDGL